MASSHGIASVTHPQNTQQVSEGHVSEFTTLLPSLLEENYLNAHGKRNPS